MAALLLQSRFAGLQIEDDDAPSSQQKAKKKSTPNSGTTAKKADAPKKKASTTKTQNATQKKKKPKSNEASSQQWEQWKQKDVEMADGNFEDELHQAILLSKLEYEEKKDVYKQNKKEAEIEKKVSEQALKVSSKKQKKKNVMSLEQFNDMVSADDNKSVEAPQDDDPDETNNKPPPEQDTEFFERVKDETKSELIKDKIYDRIRTRKTASDEVITRVQFADALERKQKEVDILKKEMKKLKEDLITVKSRNTKLCNILGQAEMKDKAEILVEVERLREVQNELTAEVTSLHTELEKERSKNPENKTRDKKKKGGSAEKEK